MPYHLHSVLIHEGSDNSGHYYVYIKWKDGFYKFNDTTVSFQTIEEMQKDAFGENGSWSAFCLFYVNEKNY